MKTLQQPEGSKIPTDIVTRRWILGGVVATLLTGALIIDNEKKNTMKVYNLNYGYNNMRMAFDQFFIFAYQDRSAPWSRDNSDGRDLIVDTEKQGEYYVISLVGNQIIISLSSYSDELLFQYTVDTSILEINGSASLGEIMDHFGSLQKLIKKQYPNF